MVSYYVCKHKNLIRSFQNKDHDSLQDYPNSKTMTFQQVFQAVGQAGGHIFQGSYTNLLCQEPAEQ